MRLILALLLGLAAIGCESAEQSSTEVSAVESNIAFRNDGTLDIVRNGQTIRTLNIEIADTDETRQKGMMERTSFPADTGMLFIMEQERVQQFWMGNTPLSLDLIFIGANYQVVDIAKEAEPYSPESIVSRVPALYVLEVPGGFSDVNGIVEGDEIRWTRL